MRPALKLSAIDQEHLQELYDSTGVARDQLPYTPEYDALCQGFQDRTFKNAEKEQVYSALLKHVRSSSCASKEQPPSPLDDEKLKQLKAVLPRHARGGKILPYSDEFDAALKEFNKLAGTELTDAELWRSIQQLQGAKRRPPRRTKVAAVAPQQDEGDDDVE